MPPPDLLARLYDDHSQALYGFLLTLTRNETDTRDLLQEVFLKLARHPQRWTKIRDERGYLLRLAHNLAIDHLRRRTSRENVRNQLAGEAENPFARTADPDEQTFRNALADALGVLPPSQRAVVHLRLWEGLTFEAIARALGISPNTAASRYRYAIDKLRERLRLLYDEIK